MWKIVALLLFASSVSAQTVQPIIVEYGQKASGVFTVTNNSLEPMAVVLEPKSFSVMPDGSARFRPLDSDIHLELSTMSVRLAPKQSYSIFYKASADKIPAWFTIYASFSSLRHGPGLALRIMLPHTVYLYQKEHLERADIQVKDVYYQPGSKHILCDLTNVSQNLGRVQQITASSGHQSTAASGGFPMLPGEVRHLDIDWNGKQPPSSLQFHFDHFTFRQPVIVQTAPSQAP